MPLHLVVTAEVEAGHVNGQDNGPVPFIMRKKPNLPPTLSVFSWSYFLRCVQASISSAGPKVPSLLCSRGPPSSPANPEPLVRQPQLPQLQLPLAKGLPQQLVMLATMYNLSPYRLIALRQFL